ncbi:hypothetical protein Nepgr_028614 [Nepenthes gracilis]|uniref:BHLH domain-containing protein n=1 Tax=Nepenthes gracilis TaxID=150966 RepID=A0AAD3TCV8_NEPGR|nr:hypothetical protein Nepgr_028614 [Nepenthes gracilis]
MASEAISSSSIDLCNLMMIYDTTCLVENNIVNPQNFHVGASAIPTVAACGYVTGEMAGRRRNLGVQGRKKKRRGRRGGKNEEEADTQRMAHIVLERNLRKRMNEHLAVLRSLVPESHAQRDDQASIVDGAIENVKELERLLQSLEVQKMLFVQKGGSQGHNDMASTAATTTSSQPPFSEFFTYHRNTGSQSPIPNRCSSGGRASMAEIKVTLTEKHANVWILSRRISSLLSKLVAGFQTLHLSIQHLNVNHLDLLVPYSISAKL